MTIWHCKTRCVAVDQRTSNKKLAMKLAVIKCGKRTHTKNVWWYRQRASPVLPAMLNIARPQAKLCHRSYLVCSSLCSVVCTSAKINRAFYAFICLFIYSEIVSLMQPSYSGEWFLSLKHDSLIIIWSISTTISMVNSLMPKILWNASQNHHQICNH